MSTMTPHTEFATISDPVVAQKPRELDLFAFVLLLMRNLWFIVGCSVLCTVIMAVAMLRAKPRYASIAVMIVPQGNVTSSTLATQLSLNTLDMLGGGFELYGDILRSRVVADRLINDFDLRKVYGVADTKAAEDQLAALTTVHTQREGLISVTVQDTSPQRAADMANDYLRQLDDMNSHLVLTNIGQQRAYLEREMVKEKDALADAEVALKQVQESTSGLAPEAQATAGLTAVENARAQLRADQIRLAALLTSETEQNPEVIRLRAEIASLTGQVESLQRGAANPVTGTPTSRVPAQELEYVRRRREVTFHETLFELLEKQYEQAKQSEAKTPSIVQVLDPAVPSTHKAWPPRTYYCLLAALVGAVVGVFLVGFKAIAQAYVRNPENKGKLEELKNFYRRRPRGV